MAGGRPHDRRPPRPPTTVIDYIIRRLHRRSDPALHRQRRRPSRSSSWCPGSAARPPTTWRRATSARARAQAQIHATAEKLGFTDPIYVQYGRFVKGICRRRRLQHRADDRALPGAVPRLLVHHPEPGAARPARPAAGDALARRRRRGALAGRRRRHRRLSALRRGSVFDRAAMGVALAGVSLPIFFTGLLSLSIFSYCLGITAPGGSYTPFDATNPLRVGVRPDPALDHAGVPLRRGLRPADPGGHARDDERGLHPHRAGQGPAASATSSSSTGCARR